jgi:hypothetical protein
MTQYERITGKVFGGNATATGNDPQIAQFGSALANTFVGTTDPATIQQLPAWGQGWIGAVTPETQFPPLPEMTGAMKVLSHQICGILQQGVSTWDNGTIYYTGNFVSLNGRLYISQVDENQGNNPETDTVNWQEFPSGANKANTNASNFTTEGKSLISSFGMPSDNYIDLTLGASGTTYTAPANGWFFVSKVTGVSTHTYLDLANNTTGFSMRSNSNGSTTTVSAIYLPCKKGDIIRCLYNVTGDTSKFRFYYAEGEI